MRTPIIVPGQVYLHGQLNEYLVVTYANQGDIRFSGFGFGGVHDVDSFLDRFDPVDPADLDEDEKAELLQLLKPNVKLTVGWVRSEEDFEEEEVV